MKKLWSVILTVAILLGLLAPTWNISAGEAKNITERVSDLQPTIKIGSKEVMKDGVMQAGTHQLTPSAKIEISYNWEINNMKDVKAGDYFEVLLPNMEGLEAFSFNAGKPIDITNGSKEVLGSFVVDTKENKITATLNEVGAKKSGIHNGNFTMEYQAKKHW